MRNRVKFYQLFTFLVSLTLFMSSCGGSTQPPVIFVNQPPLTDSNPSTSIQTSSTSPSSGTIPNTVSPIVTSPKSPPIMIALDYFGIKNTHWISQIGGSSTSQIELIVILSDDTGTLAIWPPNPEIQKFDMDFFQVISLKNPNGGNGGNPIIYTGAISGPLSLRVVANNVSKGAITKAQIDLMKGVGFADFSAFKSFVSDKELIGIVWQTWSPTNNWGIGSQFTNDVPQDTNDLKVWMRIGTTGQMPESAQQPAFNPNVKIESVTLPTSARKRQPSEVYQYIIYYTTFRLVNNELIDVTVNWQANSSITGNFDSGQVTVSRNSYKDVTKGYYYSASGMEKITYSISYRGTQLDTQVGTHNILP